MSGGGLPILCGSIERTYAANEIRKKARALDSKAVNYMPDPNGSRKERRVFASMMRKKQ